MSFSLVRFLPAAALITAGIAVMAVGTLGIFRIRYVLNRLHAAAMGDSLGLFLVVLGLVVLYGWSFASAKLLVIVALFWLASPVCSHLLAFLETSTNDELEKNCRILPLSQLETQRAEETEEGGWEP